MVHGALIHTPPALYNVLLSTSPSLRSAAPQLGLTFPFTAFDSLSHVAQKGIAVQFKHSPHGPNTGP